MQQNKKQKSFGNSLSIGNLDYPITIELPNDYWTFSNTNFFDVEIEYLDKNTSN